MNPHVPNYYLRLCAAFKRRDACYPFAVQLNSWRGYTKLETTNSDKPEIKMFVTLKRDTERENVHTFKFRPISCHRS